MKDLFNNDIPKELEEQVSQRYEWPKMVEGIELICNDCTQLKPEVFDYNEETQTFYTIFIW